MNTITNREIDYLTKILEQIAIIENQHRDAEGYHTLSDTSFLINLRIKLDRMKDD